MYSMGVCWELKLKPYPDTVENIAIREYSNIQVGLNDVVELGFLLIPEECVGHPDLGINNSIRGLIEKH